MLKNYTRLTVLLAYLLLVTCCGIKNTETTKIKDFTVKRGELKSYRHFTNNCEFELFI